MEWSTQGRTCLTCPFWQPLDAATNMPIAREGAEEGECHRWSPRPYVGPIEANFPNQIHPKWPTTCMDDWCGEHPNFGRERHGLDLAP
jgi:hypothetical protein